MGIIDDIFRTRIEIDGNQAINEIGKLQNEADDLRRTLKNTEKENKVYKDLAKEVASLDKEYKTLSKSLQTQQSLFDSNEKKITEVKAKLDQLTETQQENTKEYKQLSAELKQLEFNQNKYSTRINEVTASINTNRQAHESLEKQLAKTDKINPEWTNTAKQLDTVTAKVKELRETMGLQGLTPKQLRDYRNELQRNIDNVTFGTAQYEEFKKKLQEVNAVIRSQRDDLNDNRSRWDRLRDSWVEIRNTAIGTFLGDMHVAIFEKIVQSLADAVGNAGKLSDELADIEKFGGMSEAEAKQLNKELGEARTRTGTGDLRQIAIGGGTLGVPKQELEDFTIQVDKANVALAKEFDGNAEKVTLTLGKLKTLFEETKDLQFGEAMSRIGSALAAAGAASSAAAPQVAEFAQRIGQLGTLAPSITETLGLGAALTGDLGLNADSAAGGLTNLFIVAGQESKAFADQIGITEKAFIDLLNNDPNEMLLRLAKSMKGLSNEQVVAALTRMKVGSQESIKVMSLLKDQTEFVVEQQKLMAEEFKKNTMLQEAFDARMKTFGATLDLAKKELNGLSAGVSNALLPAMTKLLEMVVKLVIILKELPKFIADNRTTIIGLTVALVPLNLQMVAMQGNSLRVAFNFATMTVAMRAASVAINLVRIAKLGLNAAIRLSPIGWFITAIGLLIAGISYAYDNFDSFRTVIDATWRRLSDFGTMLSRLYKDMTTSMDKLFAYSTAENGLVKRFSDTFASIEKSWDDFLVSLNQLGTTALNIVQSAFGKIGDKIASFFVPKIDKIKEGFIAFGSIFTSFIDDVANTSFGEAVGRIRDGFVQLGEIFKQGYTDIVTFDYQGFAIEVGNSIAKFFTEIGKTIQAKVAKVAEGFTALGSIFVSAWDDTVNLVNELINGSFGQAVARVKEGFIALGSIFTDFGKDVKATYDEIVKYVTDFLSSIYESINEFAQENFGEEIKAVQTAWKEVGTQVDKVKQAFEGLKTTISEVFDLLKSDIVNDFFNKAEQSIAYFQTQTNPVAQRNLVQTAPKNPFKFDIAKEYNPLAQEKAPKKAPEKSAEELKLEEENRKRAEELAQQEAKNQKEKLHKLAEERKKAIEEAQKAINELQIKLMDEGAAKELAALESRYSELGLKVAEAMEKGLPKDLGNAQLELLTQNFDKEKEGVLEKWRKIGYDAVMSEAEGRQKAWEEVKNMELQRLKNEQNLRDTQTGIEALGKIADVMGNTDLNPEEQDRQVGEIERDAQQKKLDSEKSYLQDELAVNAEFGDLTIAQEEGIKLRLAEIEKEKTDIIRQNLNEQKRLREENYQSIKEGLTKTANVLGQVNQYAQQLGFEGTVLAKGLALSQIAINSAVAITDAIRGAISAASMTGPAAPFVMAGYIATAVGTAVGAIAQAKAIIDPVQPPKPQKATPMGGYFDGGDTGGTSIYEERGVVHGKEYVIPNWLRKAPQVARFENIIESVRVSKDLSKLKALELMNQTAAPTTSSPTSTANTTQNNDSQLVGLIQQMLGLQQAQIQATQNFGGRLRVVATDVQTGLDEINQLDKEANF